MDRRRSNTVTFIKTKGDDLVSHAKALTEQFNEFHMHDNMYDDPLDIFLHESYAKVMREGKGVDWTKTYFSPSSANACPRALYHKVKKHKKDKKVWQPHQRRWVQIGTGIGDMIQKEMLLMARHYKKLIGRDPQYTMGMVNGYPAFEEFIFKQHHIEHNGEKFSILGTSDGLMTVTGSDKLVGLEIKSKQQTPSKTSLSAMKEPQADHVKQVVCYSIMYDVEEFVIMYVNASHKAWEMTDEDFQKTPDIRLFDVAISESDKEDILDYFADIARRVRENDPPLPDLAKWKFNEYKDTISTTLTDDEVERLEMVTDFMKSDQPVWMQKQMDMAMNDLKRRREAIQNA